MLIKVTAMDKFSIRPATKNDYAEFMKLCGEFVENKSLYKSPADDSFFKVLENPNCRIELAVVSDKIIGFITYSVRDLIRYPKPVLEIEEFYVKEEFRRAGIGTKLMDRAIEFARKRDCQYIVLASDKKRAPAHKFYKSIGFDEYAFHYRRKL